MCKVFKAQRVCKAQRGSKAKQVWLVRPACKAQPGSKETLEYRVAQAYKEIQASPVRRACKGFRV